MKNNFNVNPIRTDQAYLRDIFTPPNNQFNNPFIPIPAKILAIIDEAPNLRTFRVQLQQDHDQYYFRPGQFAIWSLPGVGEAPFSYSSSPHIRDYIDFTIHKTGRLTSLIFGLQPGDTIGIRGTYGNGFPLERFAGKDLLFIMGGIGAAPLKGVLDFVLYHRQRFGTITVFHGARNPELMLFKEYFSSLVSNSDISCFLTVDEAPQSNDWNHNVGVVTTLFQQLDLTNFSENNTIALVCGPPIMYKYVINELEQLQLPQNHIYMTLERRMRCGLGLCGHCAIDYVYTCIEGPVFTLWDARYMKELI